MSDTEHSDSQTTSSDTETDSGAGAGTAAAPTTGALLADASAALGFWGAAVSAGLDGTGRALRGPDGRCWVELAAPPERAAVLATAIGGLPFARRADAWYAVHASGQVIDALPLAAEPEPTPAPSATDANGARVLYTGAHRERLDPDTWTELDARALLAACALRAVPLQPQPLIDLLIPAGLVRWTIEGALRRGLELELTPAAWQPAATARAASEGWMWLRMRRPGGRVSVAWQRALIDLPGAAVARPARGGGARLLIDLRHRAAVDEPVLARLLSGDALASAGASDDRPTSEPELPVSWLLAGPELGAGRILARGAWLPAHALLPGLPPTHGQPPTQAQTPTQPPAPAADASGVPEQASLAPVAVGLRRLSQHAGPATTDAVLVDEHEHGWLSRYLLARGLGETLYVVPGERRALLLSVGADLAALPFGTPLRRIGPGALFIDQTRALNPALPEVARARLFGMSDSVAVVLTDAAAWRFRLGKLAPAWTLWLGPGPSIRDAHDECVIDLRRMAAGTERLARPAVAKSEPARFRMSSEIQPAAGAPVSLEERARLRTEAATALLRGETVRAAEKLERAGEALSAARLFERAAREREGA